MIMIKVTAEVWPCVNTELCCLHNVSICPRFTLMLWNEPLVLSSEPQPEVLFTYQGEIRSVSQRNPGPEPSSTNSALLLNPGNSSWELCQKFVSSWEGSSPFTCPPSQQKSCFITWNIWCPVLTAKYIHIVVMSHHKTTFKTKKQSFNLQENH